MKRLFLTFLVLTISANTFAQRQGPSRGDGRVFDRPGRDDGRPGPGGDRPNDHRRPGTGRDDYRGGYNGRPTPSYPDYRPGPYRPGPSRVVVGPRYSPRRDSGRYIRVTIRPNIIWHTGFGYTCGYYGDLMLNGYNIHNFSYESDCYQALNDIRMYGDFCDNEDLFDQNGRLEAQFNYNYECRDALGYYY